jgi:hypothetical protein
MKNFNFPLKIFAATLVLVFAVYLSGCVNVDQKTKVSKDGSGEITLHYWTKMSNVKSSDELGGFAFTKDKASSNYSSNNTEVKDVKVEENLEDSTKHVTVEMTFKDLNNLSAAKGFEKIKASWKEGDDGMDFTYTLLQDTSSAKNMGASDTKLDYEFEFEDEVVTTNGRKDGNKVVWDKTLADLKEDIEMTATVKSAKKGCGLFGIELPLVVFAGIIFLVNRKRKK